MAEFHETRMGQKFFMADVPRLIAALERIADILEQRRVDEKKKQVIQDPFFGFLKGGSE